MYGNGKFKSVEVVNPLEAASQNLLNNTHQGISLLKYCILATLLF